MPTSRPNEFQAQGRLLHEVTMVAKMVADKYRKEEYLLVFVGRSPTPIAAAMQAMGYEVAFIASTNLKEGSSSDDPINRLIFANMRVAAHEERHIHNHVSRSLSNIPDKKIVLVDFCMSGLSLWSMLVHLRDNLRNRNIRNKVSLLGLTYYPHSLMSNAGVEVAHIPLHDDKRISNLVQGFFHQDFRGFAPYGDAIGVKRGIPPADHSEGYRQLLIAVQQQTVLAVENESSLAKLNNMSANSDLIRPVRRAAAKKYQILMEEYSF